MKKLQLVLVMLVSATLSLAACSGDDNNASNNTTNNTTPDMGKTQDMPATNNAPTTWESRYQILFTDMIFTPGSPGSGTLNTILRKSFNMNQEYPTIILVDIDKIDADAGTTRIKGGAGTTTATDGEFKWDAETPDQYYDGTIKKDDGQITGTFPDFKFIATIPTEGEPLRVTLPIQDLSFVANLTTTEGGVKIENGEMTGFLTKTQGDSIMIFVGGMTLTLTSLLKESALNLDTDGDMVNDAWKLEATFKAGPAKIME